MLDQVFDWRFQTCSQTVVDFMQKLSAGKPRGEPATSRGGKRGQSAAGKRGLNSAVRVRFAPKVMGQSTQRQAVQEPPPAQNPSLASFVSSWTVRTNKDAHMALKVARQLEAMAQEKLGIQQPAPSRSGTNGRSHQRAVVQVDELVHRPTSQRGTRRATQQFSPPAEPANPLHDPSRYDHGWDEYVDDDMEEEDVKPSIAAMHQLRNRRGVR